MSDEKSPQEDDDINIDFSAIKKWFTKEDKQGEHHAPEHSTTSHSAHKESAPVHHHESHDAAEPRKGEAHKAAATHTAQKNDDDEISIDFSKIKNFFSSKEKKDSARTPSKERAEDEISFDFGEASNFVKKHATLLLILIPVILTIFIRIQPNTLPITDDWARSSVYNYFQGQIAGQIRAQYPNLPEQNLNALVGAEFQKFLAQNKANIEAQVTATSQQFKATLQYDSGGTHYTYLGDIDSYYWLRETRKIMKTGLPCDEIEGYICYHDNYRTAPLRPTIPVEDVELTLHPYAIMYLYKILHVFNQHITIIQASFYVPLVFSIIVAIFAFLLGQQFGGHIGGLVTSIIIAVNPIFLSRSLGSDTDVYNVVFPIVIMYFLVKALKAETTKKLIINGVLCGLVLGVYNFAWTGWWFIFDFIILALIAHILFLVTRTLLQHKSIRGIHQIHYIKRNAMLTGILTVITLALATMINGYDIFALTYKGMFGFAVSKVAALDSLWPNVLVTVAEFNPAGLGTVVEQAGGKLFFVLAVLGIAFTMTHQERRKEDYLLLAVAAGTALLLVSDYGLNLQPITFMAILSLPVVLGLLIIARTTKDIDPAPAILLTIWFIGTTYAALKGIRFTLLMVPAFATALGVGISYLYLQASVWMTKEMHLKKILTTIILCVCIALLLISPVKAGYNVGKNFIPSVNAAWDGALTKIRENSKPDAIINSWWDFGHWFKFFADRRVTLDGASQGDPPLHWLGKLMLTADERQSVGILRMLDCGSNTAFDTLNQFLKDAPKTITVLDQITRQNKDTAKKTLTKAGLTSEQSQEVLKHSHCEPPEDFFITSEDMIGKSGVWAHFGSWNFTRSSMYLDVKGKDPQTGLKLLKEKYNLGDAAAQQYYDEIQSTSDNQWISPWPSYYSGINGCQKTGNSTYRCEQGTSGGTILIDLNVSENKVPSLHINSREEVQPEVIVYMTPDDLKTIEGSGKTLDFAVIIIPQGDDGYATLLSHPALGPSIFTRLFFLEGHGLKYFDKFDDRRGITGGRIITWKVDWDGKDKNLVYHQPKPEKQFNATSEELVTQDPTGKKKSTNTSSDSTASSDRNSTTINSTTTHVKTENSKETNSS